MAMEEQARECREDLGLLPSNDLQLQFCDDDGPQLRHRNDSLLRRLNRIDKILNTIEESTSAETNSSPAVVSTAAGFRSASCRHFSVAMAASDLEKRCKPTLSVLEEVLVKGTLVERVADLEMRLMKLHRIFSLKSNGKAQSLSASHVPDSHHRRVMSCGEVYGEVYDKQLLQDPNDAEKPNDVEKHEVTQFHSDRPPEKTFHIEHEPFVELKSYGPHSEKAEGPNNGMHIEMFEGVVSSGKDSIHMKPPITGAHPQLSKKHWTKTRQWLSKHLHIPLPKVPHKGKTNFSIGHCLGPQVHPLSCCNAGKREMKDTPHTHYGHMATYDE